jgi:hypothetical protein
LWEVHTERCYGRLSGLPEYIRDQSVRRMAQIQ